MRKSRRKKNGKFSLSGVPFDVSGLLSVPYTDPITERELMGQKRIKAVLSSLLLWA